MDDLDGGISQIVHSHNVQRYSACWLRALQEDPFLDELTDLKPDFRERGRDYVRRLFVTDEHVDMMCDGLAKAGLDLAT